MAAPTVIALPTINWDGVNWSPPPSKYSPEPDYGLRVWLARRYLLDCESNLTRDRVYVFATLPPGYRHWKQYKDGNRIDYFTSGHPTGLLIRSRLQLWIHLKHLIQHGNAIGCTCERCNPRKARSKSASGSVSRGPAPPAPRPPRPAPPKFAPAGPASSSSASTGPTVSGPFDFPLDPSLRQNLSPGIPLMDPQSNRSNAADLMDEDGTPNFLEQKISELREGREIKEAIEEPKSIDRLLEHEVSDVGAYVSYLNEQPRWHIRAGDVVLFVRKLGQSEILLWNHEKGCYMVWHVHSHYWVGFPEWEAGIVTQAPGEAPLIQDIKRDEQSKDQKSHGYRIEPVPEVGSEHKPWTKRFTHIPHYNTRPLVFFQSCLKPTVWEEWHPTVQHAISTMSSFSFVDSYFIKSRVNERGPYLTIFNRGIYVGPELIVEGDLVRLTPASGEGDVTEVMRIKHIKTVVILNEDDGQYFEACHISGRIATNDFTRAYGDNPMPLVMGLPARGIDGYGNWYWRHDSNELIEIPFRRILSRCYEDEALQTWFPDSRIHHDENSAVPQGPIKPADDDDILLPDAEFFRKDDDDTSSTDERADEDVDDIPQAVPNPRLSLPRKVQLGYGLDGIVWGRQASRNLDKRIIEGKSWFWANTRIEQLDLHMLKGHDVGEKAEFAFTEGLDVNPNPEPRAEKHIDAMFRALKAREKGAKGAAIKPYPRWSGALIGGGSTDFDVNKASIMRVKNDERLKLMQPLTDDAFDAAAERLKTIAEQEPRGPGVNTMRNYIEGMAVQTVDMEKAQAAREALREADLEENAPEFAAAFKTKAEVVRRSTSFGNRGTQGTSDMGSAPGGSRQSNAKRATVQRTTSSDNDLMDTAIAAEGDPFDNMFD